MSQPPLQPSRLATALRNSLFAGLLATLPLMPVSAQTVDAESQQQRLYAIPAGTLDQALNSFASIAGMLLSIDARLTEGKSSQGLHGHYTDTEALDNLLAGSGLVARFGEKNRVILEPAPAAADVLKLGAITVTANQLGTITEGSGSYTPATIATATRLALSPRETPQSISVVTRQKMDDFGLNSIDDVMRHMPGISTVTYDSERTEYYARGFAINEFQYDGIPMTRNSAYSSGNTLSDMAIYDRIEVLKGATGLLTGSGSPGATINLIRKKPTHEFRGHVSAGAGSWDTYRTELDVGGPLTESGNLRGRAVAAYQDQHSFIDHHERKTSVYYGILELDLSPDTLLTVGADYQDNKPEGSSWGGIVLFDGNGDFNKMSRSFNNGADWSNWEQYTRTLFATLEHDFAGGWLGKLQLNHQINGYDAALASAAGGNPNPADGSGTSLWLGKFVGKTTSDAADVYASGPFQLLGREHELVVGGSIAKRRWKNKGYNPPADYDSNLGDYYDWNGAVPEPDWQYGYGDDETTREHGFYATSRFNLADDLKLILGGRVANYKNEDLTESGVFVPYVGLIYDLNRNFSLYGSYTSIFAPQSYQDEQGKTIDPLEGDSYEAGIKGEFYDGRLNTSLAYFQIKQDNFAEETGGRTPSGGIAYRATQGVVTKGFEVEASGELVPGWQLQAGYTHKIARRDGDKVTTLEPEDQFNLYTSYRLHGNLDNLTVGGGARWQGKTWAAVSNPVRGTEDFHMEARWLVDAMARYEFDDNLSATFNVNNLLDKKYYTIFNWYSTYTWGDPRNMTLSVNYEF